MASFIAVVHKDPSSDFGVSFPDFPGCITVGSTIDEVKDMAHEALTLRIRGMMEDGEKIPLPCRSECHRIRWEQSVSVAPCSGKVLCSGKVWLSAITHR